MLSEEIESAQPTDGQGHRRGRDCLNPAEASLFMALAPDGCVIKISGSDQGKHVGPARVFDGEDAAFEAVKTVKSTKVMSSLFATKVTRWPGMREMLAVTAALAGRQMIAVLSTVAFPVPAMVLPGMSVRRLQWAVRLGW